MITCALVDWVPFVLDEAGFKFRLYQRRLRLLKAAGEFEH